MLRSLMLSIVIILAGRPTVFAQASRMEKGDWGGSERTERVDHNKADHVGPAADRADRTGSREWADRDRGSAADRPGPVDKPKAEKSWADRDRSSAADRPGPVDKPKAEKSWADRDRGSAADRPGPIDKPKAEKAWADRDRSSVADRPGPVDRPKVEKSWADRDRGSAADRPAPVDGPKAEKSWADRDHGSDIDKRSADGVASDNSGNKQLTSDSADKLSWADRDKPTNTSVDAKRADEAKIQSAKQELACFEKLDQFADAIITPLEYDPLDPSHKSSQTQIDITPGVNVILDHFGMCKVCEWEREYEFLELAGELKRQESGDYTHWCNWSFWRKESQR